MLTAGILLVLCALAGAAHVNSGGSRVDPADCYRNVPELITNDGYAVEIHDVVTSDGYILQMHRIPYGKDSPMDPSVKRPAVLVTHGLFSSSADLISLGYILADAGYDVWLGNCRGNTYSKRHLSINSNVARFWDFTWHEIGIYDLPAMIDYIIESTEWSAIHYIGHSQGTTSYFVLCSMMPEYNSKIKTGHMMAPVGSLEHMEGDSLRDLAPLINVILTALRLAGMDEEIMAKGTGITIDENGNHVCNAENPLSNLACSVLFETMIDVSQYDKDKLNVLLCHMPAGSALKQILHYGQGILGDLRQWDFGALRNLGIYGSLNPPRYDFTRINATKLFHYYSPGDLLTNVEDVQKLKVSLPSSTFIQVGDETFTHFDFAWGGEEAKFLVYDKIVDQMKLHDLQLTQQV